MFFKPTKYIKQKNPRDPSHWGFETNQLHLGFTDYPSADMEEHGQPEPKNHKEIIRYGGRSYHHETTFTRYPTIRMEGDNQNIQAW